MPELRDYLADAVKLGGVGFRVFPLHLVRGKVCRVNDWPNRATTDAQAIVDLFEARDLAGIGIATGEDWTVVDIDVPGEKHQHDGHASLKAQGVTLPKTLTIRTASGGEHLIYRTTDGARKTDSAVPGPTGEKLPGVDVRGAGGHFKVHDAEALIRGVKKIRDVPSWVGKAGERRESVSAKTNDFLIDLKEREDNNGGFVSDVMVAAVELFRRRTDIGHGELLTLTSNLAKATANSAGGHWGYTEARAAYVEGSALHGERGVDYGARFDDAYFGSEHLALPPVILPVDKRAAPGTTAKPKRKPRPLSDLMAQEFPPLGWVVRDVIPEGTSLLSSAPKVGKSLMILDVALACATGRHAFGGISTGKRRPVLYLDLESGERRLQARVTAQGWDEYGRFTYHLDAATAIVVLERFMRKNRGKRPLGFVDTLAAIMTDRGDKTQQYKHEYDSLKRLQVLTASDPGAAIIVAHHTRKLESSDPLAMASGTHGTTGAVDHVFTLTRPDRMRTDGVLSRVSRDVENAEFELRLVGARWVAAGGSAEDAQRAHEQREHERRLAKLGPLQHGLLQVIEASGTATLSIETIAKSYDGASDRTAIAQALRRLDAAGLIQKVGRGAYTACPSSPTQ